MSAEIELKLGLSESDQRRFLRLMGLHRDATARTSSQLTNIYYDTADLALRKRGIALRLRRQGREWLQTVKCAGASEGGLSTRPEWETPYAGHFDFSAITLQPTRAWLDRPKIRARLLPIFETSFRRTTWTFQNEPGHGIQLMLDRGWIAAAGNRESLSEVEIELQSGPINQIFELAESLAEKIALVPQSRSKAERGYNLFLGLGSQPARASSIDLERHMSPREAFRRIAFSCLEQLQRNEAGALASDDPEYIHQMRIALRRLRAAVHLFRTCLPVGFSEHLLPPLREFMGILGNARDFDVLLGQVTSPVSQAMPEEPRLAMLTGLVSEHGHASRHAALAAMAKPEHGRNLLHAIRLIHQMDMLNASESTLIKFARIRMRKLHRRCLSLVETTDAGDPHSLHALRIAIKRLRYATEFFSPLDKTGETRALLKRLSDSQDRLGTLNDLANAGELLMRCADEDPRLREAVALIGGWHGAHYKALLDGIPAMLKQLHQYRLPHWR